MFYLNRIGDRMKVFLVIMCWLSFLGQNTYAQENLKKGLSLQGSAIYEWMWIDVYKAHLFVTENIKLDQDHYKQPLLLELEYFMSLDGKEIAKQSVKEIDSQVSLDESEKSRYQKDFENIFPDVKKGDRISAFFKPDEGLKFYLNSSSLIGEIKNSKDSKRFIDIWLGQKTSDPAFRKELLK